MILPLPASAPSIAALSPPSAVPVARVNAWESSFAVEAVSVKMGAGEVVVNSIDTDGVKKGFDIEMLNAVCNVVNVPVIASGGAGKVEDFIDLFKKVPKIDAGLAASVFHFGEIEIKNLKKILSENGIEMRL